jgi:biotin operon repressor/predicted phosphodiesterase
MKKFWSKEENERLTKIVKESPSLIKLRKKVKEAFPDRPWTSVESKIRRLWEVKKGKISFAEKDDKSSEGKGGTAKMEKKKDSSPAGEKVPCEGTCSPGKGLTEEQEKILRLIKKKPVPLDELAEMFDKSKDKIYKLFDCLRTKGYDVVVQVNDKGGHEVTLTSQPVGGMTTDLGEISRQEVKFLVISDTGFGLKAQQPHLVATALEIGKEEKVDFILHAGNVTGGKPTSSDQGDFLSGDFDDQVDYAVNKIPKTPCKIYYLNGPRDLKHKRKGQNVGRAMAERRDSGDFRYEGDLEANFVINGLKIKLLHVKDIVTYTKSYTLQGLAENFQEAVTYVLRKNRRPDLLLVGGVHASLYYPAKKKGGMQAIGLPALHSMTSTQKSRKKRGGSPVLGCVVVTVKLDKDGNPIDVGHTFYNLTAYQRSDSDNGVGHSGDETNGVVLNEEQKQVLNLLQGRPRRYGEISRDIGKSKQHVEKIVKELQKIGLDIFFDAPSGKLNLKSDWKTGEFKPIPLDELFVKTVKTATFSDPHIGNKKARPDLIPKAYKIAEEEKVDAITVEGDIFDGMDAYRGHENELAIHGADKQREAGEKIWPDSKITTYIIAGSSHEWGYFLKSGHNIVKTFAKNIKNLVYIGGEVGLSGIVNIKGILHKLVHPKGGLPYGKSYRMQQRIEGLVEEIEQAGEGVRVLEVGHLHIAFFMIYKGIAAFMVPCMEEKTWYLESKGLNPWLGMWIMTVSCDKYNNITRVTPKYISFENHDDEDKKKKKDK